MSPRVALLGKPLAESLSPRMQNAAFVAAGRDWEYVALEVEPRLRDEFTAQNNQADIAFILNVQMQQIFTGHSALGSLPHRGASVEGSSFRRDRQRNPEAIEFGPGAPAFRLSVRAFV